MPTRLMPDTPSTLKKEKKPKAKPRTLDEEPEFVEIVSELKSELSELKSEISQLKEQIGGTQHLELAETVSIAPEAEILDIESDVAPALSTEELDALYKATQVLDPDFEEQDSDTNVPEESEPHLSTNEGLALSDEEILALLAPQSDQAQFDENKVPDTQIVPAEEIMAMLGLADPAAETPTVAPTVSTAKAVAGQEPVAQIQPDFEGGTTLEVEEGQEVQLENSPTSTTIDLDHCDPSVVQRVSGQLAARALAFPVCVVDGQLHCISIEPFDQEALNVISKSVGLQVVPHAADPFRVLGEIRLRYNDIDDQYTNGTSVETSPGPLKSLIQKILRRPA